MAKLLGTCALFLIPLLLHPSRAQLDPHAVNELFEDMPSLEAYHSMLHEDAGSDPEAKSQHLKKLRMLFRFANLKNTPVDEVLERGGVDMEQIMDVNFNNILDMIETDRDFRWRLFNELMDNSDQLDEFLDFTGTDLSSRWPILARDGIYDEDYLECYKDYSSVAEYRTYKVLERVGTMLLTDLFADVDDQQQFCDTACQTICGIISGDRGCELACEAVCVSSDYNRTTIVPAILDFFIPEVEQYSWGRQMVDAMAKIPSGLMDANLMWTGSYYMCYDWVDGEHYNYTNTTSNETEARVINGKYCRLPFQPPSFQNSSLLFVYFGACVPSTCSKEHIHRYIYEDNLVFKVLLTNILEWDMDPDLIFCDHETDLGTDGSAIACLTIICLLLVINLVATQYDVHFRLPMLKKKLEKEAAEQASNQSANGYMHSNPTYETTKRTTVTGVGGYNHVDDDELNRYSRLDNFSNNNNQVGVDNGNNNNSGPTLQHSISTSSTRPLYESYMSTDSAIVNDDPPTWKDRLEVAFVGFSAHTNMKNIFQIRKPEGYIETLDFFRFLSFLWVLFGHTWLFGPLYTESWCAGNLISSLYWFPAQLPFQPVINFHLAGDTFFVISGLLTTYNWLRKYDQGRESLTWRGVLGFYLRRYWALVPTLMMVLMFYAAMYKYVSGGPLAPIKVQDAENCKVNWWPDLLLIHNLVNTHEMCLSWTWYVACVFQLHLIAPLILIPLIVFPVAGYAVLGVLYIIHISATAAVSSHIWEQQDVGMWFTDYLVTPWCRAGPYFIGMALGIFLYEKKLKVKIHEGVKALCGLVSLFLLFAPAYGTYTRFKDGLLYEDWSKAEQVMWDTFSRSCWALGVSWFIMVGSTGNAGYLGDWMNHNMHQPFARMVYPSFLFHSLMVFGNVYSQHVVIYINWSKIIQTFLSNVCICLALGVLFVGLLFHYPLSYGILKAFSVKTKRECIEVGNHPPLPETGVVTAPDVSFAGMDAHAQQPSYLRSRNTPKEAFTPGTPKTTTKF